jgi:hypothetical protein
VLDALDKRLRYPAGDDQAGNSRVVRIAHAFCSRRKPRLWNLLFEHIPPQEPTAGLVPAEAQR